MAIVVVAVAVVAAAAKASDYHAGKRVAPPLAATHLGERGVQGCWSSWRISRGCFQMCWGGPNLPSLSPRFRDRVGYEVNPRAYVTDTNVNFHYGGRAMLFSRLSTSFTQVQCAAHTPVAESQHQNL